MGSSSSKSVEEMSEHKTSNFNNSSKKSPAKTSIYGWGRLKHPLKPGQSKSKNKLLVGYNKDTVGQNDTELHAAKTDKKASLSNPNLNKYHETDSESRERKASVNIPIVMKYSNGNGVQSHPQSISVDPVLSVPSSNGIIPGNGHNTESPKPTITTPTNNTTPFKKQVLSNPSFYGHYRCSNEKCGKYWRSGMSREGSTQNCSKCGTPTTPRR